LIFYCCFQVLELLLYFQRIYLAISKLWFCPTFWSLDTVTSLVFWVFPSRPTSPLASNGAPVFSFMVFTFSPQSSGSGANVFHSIPILPHFLGSSWWHILKQRWKAMEIKHLLVWDHSEQEMHQTSVYADFTIGIV